MQITAGGACLRAEVTYPWQMSSDRLELRGVSADLRLVVLARGVGVARRAGGGDLRIEFDKKGAGGLLADAATAPHDPAASVIGHNT